MRLKFQSPTGMHDIFGEQQEYFQKIYEVISGIVDFYGFGKIDTPVLEQTELFLKGVGLNTEIVQKQMFSFKTKGGDHVTLRPEGTASVIRAYLENGMYTFGKPVKLWYFAPFFRYEKPQFGRFRQFWQFGLETIGEENPARDAEIIQIIYNILLRLKLKDTIIHVNSIGASCCRPYYKKLLSNYLKARINGLCASCRRKVKPNPLRIMDCKEEKCQRLISQAPQMIDHLCQDCRRHFKNFLEFLDELEIPYHLNPYLVRGLDYYTKTVFEIFPAPEKKKTEREEEEEQKPDISQVALIGGGRYDGLIKTLGGKPTPAVGVSGGIERIITAMKDKDIKVARKDKYQVFLAQLGGLAKRRSLKLIEEFRKAKIPILESLGRDSLRAQLKIADKEGIKYTLLLGQKEALNETIIIRYMSSGKQREIKLENTVKEMKKLLKK
jgi:histidyl-tRNA synthetase